MPRPHRSEYGQWMDEIRSGPDEIRREQRKQRILGVLLTFAVAFTCAMLWVMG